MYLEVYPDVIFVVNFCMDLVLLSLLKIVNRKKSKIGRILGAAAVGAGMACIVGVCPWMNMLLRFVLMYIAAGILMVWIAFGRLQVFDFIKQVIVLYIITYFVGGMINSIYYHTNLKSYFITLVEGGVIGSFSWKFITITVLLITPVVLIILCLYRRYQNKSSNLMEVTLELGGKSVQAKGLFDTGNCLYDPIYRKPVIIVEQQTIEGLLSPEFKNDMQVAKRFIAENNFDTTQWNMDQKHVLRLRFIPYQSIGKTKGMLIGLILDKVMISTGTEINTKEKVIAAIYDNQLSPKEKYQVILHKELL